MKVKPLSNNISTCPLSAITAHVSVVYSSKALLQAPIETVRLFKIILISSDTITFSINGTQTNVAEECVASKQEKSELTEKCRKTT